jgi:CheY-like chemotaxis protein
MPGIDGLTAAAEIRERARHQPKIVLVTAFPRDSAAAASPSPRLDGRLSKPVTRSSLSDLLAELFTAPRPSIVVPTPTAADARLDGLRLLLAEDNEINAEIAVALLKGHGVSVDVVTNGVEAIARLQNDPLYDGVLMDVQMPVMDGLTATRRLREAGFTLPILAMTANALTEDRAMTREAGMNDHITKPIDPARMRDVIAAWCKPGAVAADERTRTPSPAPAIEPALDRADGLARMGDDVVLYERMLRRFSKDHAGDPDTLRTAFASEDWTALAEGAHKLKGVAATMGAKRVAALASAIDKDAKAKRGEARRLDDLASAMQDLVAEIRASRPRL